MKNIFSKNVFKKQFGIHIYSNYSPRDYRVSVMFRLRITRIFPRYSSAIPECSREGIEIQRRQGSLIASFYFYSFIDSFPNACIKAKHESPVIGPSSIVPFVAKTKFPTTSFSSLSTLNISPLKTVYTVWQSTDFVRWNVFNRRGCKHYRDITSPFFFRLDISYLLMFIDKNYSIFYACLTRNTTLISGGKSLD